MIFQDPFGSLNPAKTIRHHLERPLRIHGIVPRARGRGARPRAAPDGRPRAARGHRGEVPARALGRPAPARRDRARARGRAEGAARGRADEHARRLDPHRDPEPDAEAQGGARDRVPLRHARPRERALRRRRHPRHVRRARSSSRGRSSRCSPSRCTRTRGCCSRPCRTRRPGSTPQRIEARKGRAAAAVDPPEGCRFVSRCPLAIDVCSQVTPPLVEARPEPVRPLPRHRTPPP